MCRHDTIKLSVLPAQTIYGDLPALSEVNIEDWICALGFPLFDLNAPIPLQPIAIPKPWGQEIWYTGIEQRGVAEVGVAR